MRALGVYYGLDTCSCGRPGGSLCVLAPYLPGGLELRRVCWSGSCCSVDVDENQEAMKPLG